MHMQNKQELAGQAPPQTFKELMAGKDWRATKRLLRRTGRTITVMESPLAFGRYSAVVLTGRGFEVESGRGGMSAAFAPSEPERTPVKGGAKKVLERVMAFNTPLEDDPPGIVMPSESKIVSEVLEDLEKIRRSEK